MNRYAEQQRRTLIFVVLFFLFLTAAIVAVGYKSYRGYEAESRADTEHWLSVIAKAKADAVSEWHTNLLNYGDLIYENQAFSSDVAAYFQYSYDTETQTRIREELQAYQRRDEIDGVALLNMQGQNSISIPTEFSASTSPIIQENPDALKSKQIVFVDFYREATTGHAYVAILVPIMDANLVIGFVVLRIDPQIRLYPALSREITDTPATQTYLVRREGSEAVILSPLPFNPDAELNLRIPLQQSQTLEARAALGQTGIVESEDYRGVAMIADVHAAPQGWVLITQTSVAEMYDSIKVYFGRTVIVTGTVVFYTAMGLALIWRQQLLRRYKAESEAAFQRATELDEKVRERTAELSALSRQMAEMHEKQIRSLAQELHDGIGQNLSAINLNLTLLHQLLNAGSTEAMKSRLADTSQLVEESVVRMRDLVADFLPPMLQHYGLTSALSWYGEQFSRRTNVQVNVHDRRASTARLSTQAEVGLFRIAQEALNNVTKHANAAKVEIQIDEDGEYVQMTISDNGIGFDPQALSPETPHWGIAIMRERARALGATLGIQSAPNAGTKITLRMARRV